VDGKEILEDEEDDEKQNDSFVWSSQKKKNERCTWERCHFSNSNAQQYIQIMYKSLNGGIGKGVIFSSE
jgi:hypothetical protein